MGILKGFFKYDVEEEELLVFTPPAPSAPKLTRPFVPFVQILEAMSSEELLRFLRDHSWELNRAGDVDTGRLLRVAANRLGVLLDAHRYAAEEALREDIRRNGT